jgi:osmotically-inducible protein OsmY
MKYKYPKLFLSSITIAILSTQLTGCVGLLVAGAAGGAAVAMDRRDVELILTINKLNLKSIIYW